MDYTEQSFLFKLKKGLRYIELYGINRTLAKINAQYHMKKKFNKFPEIHERKGSKAHVGLIGCGKFGYSNIAYYIIKNFGKIIRGAMDIDINKSISVFQKYNTDYYTNEADKIINDPDINLIFISSNHASHAEYAISALQMGKSVHIEKPHVVSIDQLVRLCIAMQDSKGGVRLGFNRPGSILGEEIKKILLKQSGTAMFNWFVAGHEIEDDHWYFAKEEGGRVLGNLCHWTDFILQMVPYEQRFPITIIPSRSQKSDCDISVSLVFGDGSIGTITFSAKGHTFEGVREALNAHKGNALIQLRDFKSLRIDIIDKRIKRNLLRRDHGHEQAILNSYNMINNQSLRESVAYVWDTGYLVLKTKEALENNCSITIDGFEISFLNECAKFKDQKY